MTTSTTRKSIPKVNLDDYECIIARIESTTLGVEDHGILSAWLFLQYGNNGGQGVGGYSLDQGSNEWNERVGHPLAGTWILKTLSACSAGSWEKLPGKVIYALKEKGDTWGPVIGIAPLPVNEGEPFLFKQTVERLYPATER